MNKFKFLKALISPFKPFKFVWYFGVVKMGTPYFFPRRWVKDKDKPGWTKSIPKKIGFDFVGLGWKTKWEHNDYRFEWSPIWSFVFFKYQIALMFIPPVQHHYWTAWLYYENDTDHKLSKKERIKKCQEEFGLTYTVHNIGQDEKIVNYYNEILKDKYLIK